MNERSKELQVLLDHLSNETNLLHQAKLRRQIQKIFKNQAERVEELVDRNTFLEFHMGVADKAIKENQRYKQALENIKDIETGNVPAMMIAREALEGTE